MPVEYDLIESGIAGSCCELGGPHPYLALRRAWTLGRDPYLVVTIGSDPRPDGANFETADGTWFTIAGAPDAETALSQAANKGSSALEVRPSWSYAAPEWRRSNPELWSLHNLS